MNVCHTKIGKRVHVEREPNFDFSLLRFPHFYSKIGLQDVTLERFHNQISTVRSHKFLISSSFILELRGGKQNVKCFEHPKRKETTM